MAGVLGVVVAYELLLTLDKLHPVRILNGGGIAGTVLLLLHLHVELLFVDGETILTADKLCEVEREAIGVEETEGLDAIQLGLLLTAKLLHSLVEQRDALVEGAEEGVLLFLDDAADELLLSLQFGEGVAHLLDERRQELVEESLFLTEEGIGVAHGAAQDAADDIAGLGIARQLAVGDRE